MFHCTKPESWGVSTREKAPMGRGDMGSLTLCVTVKEAKQISVYYGGRKRENTIYN